jgi:arsenate reductase
MANWTIFHNPRCITSRKALALLREAGIEPKIVEYLKTPANAAELKRLVKALGFPATDLPRHKEPQFKALKLDQADEARAIEAMAEHPILIERPVVLKDGRAILARPPEKPRELPWKGSLPALQAP